MPKISVIMPVYNGEKYLNEAIDSILNQTFSDFEFIIINDCSTDNTENIIKSYDDKRIRYIKNEKNLGVAETLNKGLDMAQGEFIARMDADDISLPERFEKQLSFLQLNPECGVCGSNILIFEDNINIRELVYSETHDKIMVDMIFNSAFAHPAVMMRKDVLDNAGLRYNFDFEKAEDYRLWYDILSVSNGYNIQECFLRYRHHKSQVTKTHKTEQNIAVNKMREVMYRTLNLGTDDYFSIFSRICDGVRKYSQDEYMQVRNFMISSLKADNIYNKKILKRVLLSINLSIFTESRPKGYKPISLKEYIHIIKSYFI